MQSSSEGVRSMCFRICEHERPRHAERENRPGERCHRAHSCGRMPTTRVAAHRMARGTVRRPHTNTGNNSFIQLLVKDLWVRSRFRKPSSFLRFYNPYNYLNCSEASLTSRANLFPKHVAFKGRGSRRRSASMTTSLIIKFQELVIKKKIKCSRESY